MFVDQAASAATDDGVEVPLDGKQRFLSDLHPQALLSPNDLADPVAAYNPGRATGWGWLCYTCG